MNAPRPDCPLCGRFDCVVEDRPLRGMVRCDLCGDRMQVHCEWRFAPVEAEHASGCAHAACYALGEVAGFDRDRIEAWLSVARECDAADAVNDLPPVERERGAELWRRRQGVAT